MNSRHCITFLNCSSDTVNPKPLGVNPPASLSNAKMCFSLFAFASSAYLFPPLKPFSSLANNTNRIVLLGLYPIALNALNISMVCTQPAPSSCAPSQLSQQSKMTTYRNDLIGKFGTLSILQSHYDQSYPEEIFHLSCMNTLTFPFASLSLKKSASFNPIATAGIFA